jgi:hypothetical protein
MHATRAVATMQGRDGIARSCPRSPTNPKPPRRIAVIRGEHRRRRRTGQRASIVLHAGSRAAIDVAAPARAPSTGRSVMRAITWARGATCVLAITICVPALADHPNRSIASCTAFDQAEKGEDKVAFTIRSTCSIPIDCAVSWRVVCAPQSKKRRASHPSSAKFAVTEGGSESAEASAAVCGDDGWTIDSVQWRCEPNKD